MSAVVLVLVALLLFQVKHLLADFVLQTAKMVEEKGHYGCAGGLYHAGIHILASAPLVLWLAPHVATVAVVLVAEFVIHYHIDWCKEQIGRRLALSPGDKAFWFAIGVDQLLHQLTYIGMVWWLIKS